MPTCPNPRPVIFYPFTRFLGPFPRGTMCSEINALLPDVGFLQYAPLIEELFWSWSREGGDAMKRKKLHKRFLWEKQFTATISETDEVRLGMRIQILEAILLMRLLDLTGAPEDQEESKAVEAELRKLALLKQERGIA